MYSIWDFLLVIALLVLACIFYGLREYIMQHMKEIEAANQDDPMKLKAIKLLAPMLFVAFVAVLLLGLGTLTMPLLTVLFGELVAKLGAFTDKYGGICIIAVCFIVWWRERHPKQPLAVENTTQTLTIDEVRARAERTYPTMQQTAYAVFADACRYLPGLISPFSLAAVTAPVKFDILPSFIIVYHFVLGKGNCDAPVDTVKEILESIIDQRLRAKDLPLAVEPVYVSVDGSTWPSLVVDGVHDLGSSYRVDLVITDEAEVARLKARGVAGFDDGANTPQPNDPDFV